MSVGAGASSGELNRVGVTGGGAPSASMSQPITVDSSPTPFGVESYEFEPEEVGGSPATQAGSHPFQLTSTIYLNGGAQVSGRLGIHKSAAAGDAEGSEVRVAAGAGREPDPVPGVLEHAVRRLGKNFL